MSPETKVPKPGAKTSEFWLTVTLSLVSTLAATGVISVETEAQLALAIPQAVALAFYIYSRVKAKS